MYHTIIPIFNGFFSVDLASLLNIPESYWPFNPLVDNSPSFIFLIIGEDGTSVLVDTGFSKDYVYGYHPCSSWLQNESDELPHALKARGFQTENIGQVVLTHIHWDHTGGMEYFPNSTFYVQAEDFRALFRLQPNEETGFCPSHWLPCLSRIQVIEGNMEIKPGIKLIHSGGHTAGHQMVEVETKAGKVLLEGDKRFDYSPMWRVPQENWDLLRFGPGKHMFWSSDVLPAVKDWLKTKQALDSPVLPTLKREFSSDYHQTIFSHDPRLLNIKSIP